ncbi:(2Fe-2S)-binding protein [Desulfohalovibrio reitneri]|uniref:(2Fe-2S)-binding protein n=1 Tax=Desulfohalovibrio reitneri TaxID=1307759 RepID=UPI0004A6C97F|nr:(2Fe-2S)-binding protein [Desulfohalovibrio reitneri]
MRKKSTRSGGLSRRRFIQTMSASAACLAVAGPAARAGAETGRKAREDSLVDCGLDINGRRYELLVEPRWTLLHVLREELGLTGSKEGCHRGECGACTVLMDDLPRYACLTLAVEAQGHRIETIEGLKKGEDMGPTQEAFAREDAFQCGYCTPGQVVAAEGLLRENSEPDLEAVRLGMSGNLCRCGAYANIQNAVHTAVRLKKGG